jgi:hypothetical protein
MSFPLKKMSDAMSINQKNYVYVELVKITHFRLHFNSF